MADSGTPSEAPPFVHLIAGPTGVGKSAAATDLARVTGAPVVVADRLQCFTDLATTSARAGAAVPGVHRHWLGDRTVADGDLSAAQATDSLVNMVEELGRRHGFVIVEGGSISLLRGLSARRADLDWRLTVRLLPVPERAEYVAALTRRARVMLAPPAPDRGLLGELAALWQDPQHRWFAASVNGFEAVLECCAKYSLNVKTLHERTLPEHILARMADLIAERHAEHGFLQHRVFTEIFETRISGNSFSFGALERAA
ncbi:isopentenyl transferase family protein [Streptomyces europaeiscabiei]|uniref:isopentenyl transferase family protein n=1 Tax=Streptomyces europaeiscabiei TaxID=146819 RepID=UPI002E2D6579|nr:isopentenyl transferase family protein [Streptomyces europaeiscabiei]